MLEYLLSIGIRRISRAVRQYFLDRELYTESIRACEENKRAYERVMITLDNPKKMSELVNCLRVKSS
jgi:hypothetical protein